MICCAIKTKPFFAFQIILLHVILVTFFNQFSDHIQHFQLKINIVLRIQVTRNTWLLIGHVLKLSIQRDLSRTYLIHIWRMPSFNGWCPWPVFKEMFTVCTLIYTVWFMPPQVLHWCYTNCEHVFDITKEHIMFIPFVYL
jgi:hypothetical protein